VSQKWSHLNVNLNLMLIGRDSRTRETGKSCTWELAKHKINYENESFLLNSQLTLDKSYNHEENLV
jgi:hypothetical protein